jgi:hypothetical protein
MRRPHKHPMEIDVVPYLDSMVIVLNLICLILIIMLMPIALNPKAIEVLSFEDLFRAKEQRLQHIMIPTYFDCSSEGITILPGGEQVGVSEMRQSGNPVEKAIRECEHASEEKYIVLLIRPNSLPVYRYVRKMLGRRNIAIGFDVLASNAKLDWEGEMRNLRITIDE